MQTHKLCRIVATSLAKHVKFMQEYAIKLSVGQGLVTIRKGYIIMAS